MLEDHQMAVLQPGLGRHDVYAGLYGNVHVNWSLWKISGAGISLMALRHAP
jgi:hypothetical protein